MRTPLPLIISFVLAITACLTVQAQSSEPASTRAFFNPQVSSRDVALNQSVTVSFTTLRPQVEDIDPLSVVLTALNSPAVRDDWRVWGEPRVEVDPKIGTLRSQFVLLPRQPGNLTIPDIPVRWLRGNQVARFGQVTVHEHLAHGARTISLPDDYHRIHGYTWGMSGEDVIQRSGISLQEDESPQRFRFAPRPGLSLEVRSGRLAVGRIEAPGLPFQQARGSFHERWGDTMPGSRSDAAMWMLGWIRIEARAEGDGTIVELTHEGIEERITRGEVQNKIFSLLEEGSGSTPSSPETAPQAPSRSEAPDDQTETPTLPRQDDTESSPAAPPSAFDPHAEFERQLRRTPDPDQR
ncbi:MAG: hypothetical protein EA401_04995 [Planctomycetota bacterium]|nr:MAG: hypothetical protein EA401_04995 [Planctomycetota bacterium]